MDNEKHVSLEEMLFVREKRVELQNTLLEEFPSPLLSFTMNIAGPVKRSPLIDFAFATALDRIYSAGLEINKAVITREKTGCQAVFSINCDADVLKAFAISLEDEREVGRLYDLDVITREGKLSRSQPRKCLLCEKSAAVCARSRAHSLESLTKETQRRLLSHACRYLADIAHFSLVAEVETTPKPGLVDKNNNGAHSDMDIRSFILSADSLHEYFCDAVEMGFFGAGETVSALMSNMRKRGLEAEKTMFEVTSGVNTHKGMIYSMGILLCALGRSLASDENCLELCAALAKSDGESTLAMAARKPQSHGDRVYKETGAKGARGEAMAAFPNSRLCALYLAEYEKKGFDDNTAAALSLARLINQVDDSNLLYRGGTEGLEFAKSLAKKLIALPEEMQIEALFEMDREFIEAGLSPGGCADILAMGIFLHRLSKLEYKETERFG